RAINGSSAFFPTLGAGFIVVGLHRLLTRLTVYSDSLGRLVKGTEDTVIKNGKLVPDILKANDISHRDLLEELRLNGQINDPADAELAVIERNGQISVVPKE